MKLPDITKTQVTVGVIVAIVGLGPTILTIATGVAPLLYSAPPQLTNERLQSFQIFVEAKEGFIFTEDLTNKTVNDGSRTYQGMAIINATNGTKAIYYLDVYKDDSSAKKAFRDEVLYLQTLGLNGSFKDPSNSSWSGRMVWSDGTRVCHGGVNYLPNVLTNAVGHFLVATKNPA